MSGGTLLLAVLVRLLLSVADQRAVSRRLDAALAEQQGLAITGVLTELYNRRFIEEMLTLEVARAGRDGGQLSPRCCSSTSTILKTVNDTHGHQAGDAVLAEAAVRLHGGMRDVDVLGRWGGEEFLAVLRGADAHTALAVADRARQHLHGTTIRLATGIRITVTVTVGVALSPRHGRDPELLLHEADQALYTAKQNGRNQTRLAGAAAQQNTAEPATAASTPPDSPAMER